MILKDIVVFTNPTSLLPLNNSLPACELKLIDPACHQFIFVYVFRKGCAGTNSYKFNDAARSHKMGIGDNENVVAESAMYLYEF